MIYKVSIPNNATDGWFPELNIALNDHDIEIFQVHPKKESQPILWAAAKKGVLQTGEAFKLALTITANPSMALFKKELTAYLKRQ
jgi:hypothetical protein